MHCGMNEDINFIMVKIWEYQAESKNIYTVATVYRGSL